MAAIPSNAATLAMGKQSAKGTPQTTPTYKLKFVGGDVAPDRQEIELEETDSSVQAGATVIVGANVAGSPEHYLRVGDEFALIAQGSLGANADSGTTPNYTHTATPASTGPYFTLFKAINSTSLVDRYSDCRITGLRVRGQAGGAITYSVDWFGLSALLGQTDPVLTPVAGLVQTYPQVTCTLNGSAPGTVDSFEVNIERGGGSVQGDSGLANIDYIWGKFRVSGTLSLLFEDDTKYRAFHTGTTSGTALTTTVYEESLDILIQVNANLSVKFQMAKIAYTAYPVGPDPGGAPLRVAAAFRTQPQSAIANTLSVITKNQNATP